MVRSISGTVSDRRGQAFEHVRSRLRELSIGREAIMQPATDEIAGRPAAMDHLVMAGPRAQIARPAGVARLLPMHMSLGEPARLLVRIDAAVEIAHIAAVVA